MCLIAFDWQPGQPIPLRLAANRDEFYARPTAAADWWVEHDILAGRDLQAGGSWLGISRNGRLAALTNYRDPSRIKPGSPSRGQLVVDFLRSDASANRYLSDLRLHVGRYNDFNLLVYDGRQLLGYESRADRVLRFGRGVHGVSNACFDTPWPKLENLKTGLRQTAAEDVDALLALLADERIAPDTRLPSTGVPLEWERALSAAFIRSPEYGTRCTSVVLLGAQNGEFIERRFERGQAAGESRFEFPWLT